MSSHIWQPDSGSGTMNICL